jgi:hypothetical protein
LIAELQSSAKTDSTVPRPYPIRSSLDLLFNLQIYLIADHHLPPCIQVG